jgi:hypothetical protein
LVFRILYYNIIYCTNFQSWHVHTPRPVESKLAADTPLLTDQVSSMFILCPVYMIKFFILIVLCLMTSVLYIVFLMPFSPQYLVGLVPYLELSVVEKQSLVRLYLR